MTRPLRVLHVMEALGGGTARHLIDLVRHVPGVHHETATPIRRIDGLSDDAAVASLRSAGAVVHIVPMRRSPAHPDNVRAVPTLRRIIREGDFDIVHGHSSIGGALARLAAVRAGSRRVYTPHGLATSRLAVGTERALAPLTDHLIAVSESEGDLALRLHLTTPAMLSVVPNGIDPEPPASDLDLRARLGLPAGTPLVGTIGRLVPQKAPEVFLRACLEVARLRPEAHFVYIGDGPLRESIRRTVGGAREAGRIHHVPHLEAAARVIGQFDVFCLTSRFEGGPYTPLEAMRAGVPIVVTDAVGNRDAVQHGTSGLIVRVGDWLAVSKAILSLLDDRLLARRLGQAGHLRFRQKFTVQAMGLATRDVYAAICVGSSAS